MMNVAPVGGGLAAGEDAVPVADLGGLAQWGRGDPPGAAVVEQLPVGAHHDAADVAVAGQPTGPGGGDGGPEAHLAGGGAGGGIGQVVDVDHHQHVRSDGAQDRQAAGGERHVGPLHQPVTELLGAVACVTGGPVGLHEGLQYGLDLLPTDRVEVEPAAEAAVGMLGQGQRPTLGGIGLRPVGIEPDQVVLHHPPQVHVLPGGRSLGEHHVDLRHVDVLIGRLRQVLRIDDGGDHRDLVSCHPAIRAGRRDGGQLRQRPAVAHHLLRCARRQPAVPPQPRRHRRQAVVLGRLRQLGVAGGAGELSVDAVARPHEFPVALQHARSRQREEILVGEGIQR
jgi:hypothetical protein